MNIKHCIRCNTTKNTSDFYHRPNRKTPYSPWCRPCTSNYVSQHRNKENYKVYKAKYYKENRLKKKGYDLKKYGIGIVEYNSLLSKQANGCAICKKEGQLSVDHCHLTNNVRGLLCSSCNFMLGHAKDSLQTLKSAIDYLQNNEEKTTL